MRLYHDLWVSIHLNRVYGKIRLDNDTVKLTTDDIQVSFSLADFEKAVELLKDDSA